VIDEELQIADEELRSSETVGRKLRSWVLDGRMMRW
jgi:hypothetical protein